MDISAENKKRKTRIGIDARFYGPIGKGLGRYTQEIVDNIIKIDPVNEYVVFLRKENFDELQTDNPNVKKVIADVRWYTFAEQFLMPLYIWREGIQLMHFPHFNVPVFCPSKLIVTIHDLILIRFPTARATTLGPILYKLKNIGYRIVIKWAMFRAKKIITVSEYTKKDIVDVFKIPEGKIAVTYEGVANLSKNRDSLFEVSENDKNKLLGYNITKPYILYVGNAYPHKNLEGLLKIFLKLKEKKHNLNSLKLVLVGKIDYFYTQVVNEAVQLGLYDKEREENDVIFPGYVPDEDLESFYKNAEFYVFPSYFEGFGLPPLEAMVKGCPVISSSRTSMPEVLGDAALYFDPADDDSAILQMEKILDDSILRDELIKKGLIQAKKYNWWECARATHDIYMTAA